ncbi:MAG TPA: hypothetical protein VFF57_00805, partial [Hanamia sp.]|nr:hypothetical protein [Hanamia sp.]
MRRPKNRSNNRDIRHWIIACIAFWILSPLISNGQKVISITVNDGINPSTAEYIEQGIETAQKVQAQCLIINLNTPGGLL